MKTTFHQTEEQRERALARMREVVGKAKPVNFIRNVVRVDRSPMNERIWCIQLECNHDVFVTSKHKPSRKRMHCERCERQAAA